MESNNYLFKILVVGCGGVGKTCCIRKLVYNSFNQEYKTTIGVDFAFKVLKLRFNNQDVQVRLQLWDIAGQEKFSNLTRAYYKDAFGCLVVGDLEQQTFVNDVNPWYDDIKQKVKFPETSDVIPCMLLCNKSDKAKAMENWENQEFQAEINKLGFQGIFKTSALTGEGLLEALESLCIKILEKQKALGGQNIAPVPSGLVVSGGDEKTAKKGCC